MKDHVTIRLRYADKTNDFVETVLHQGRADSDLLEALFAGWNAGSGAECPDFTFANCRSLSVGDFVQIGDTWYRCEGCGWKHCSAEFVTNWFAEFDKRMGGSTARHIAYSVASTMIYELESSQLASR